jgi:hypothetical protein
MQSEKQSIIYILYHREMNIRIIFSIPVSKLPEFFLNFLSSLHSYSLLVMVSELFFANQFLMATEFNFSVPFESIPSSSSALVHNSSESVLNSSSLNEESLNPYYLHHGDSPGSMLVSQLLDGENYQTWSRSMVMALTAKNKLGFIDGSIKKPSDVAGSVYRAWIRCNTMVLSWILNSISKDIASSVIYIDSAEAVWTDLKERFSLKNGPRIYQLQKSIFALSQDNLSIGAYFTKLKALWDELSNYRPIPLCSCGSLRTVQDYFQHEYVFQFLMGLNDTFSHIKGQMLLIDPLPPTNKVFSLILQEGYQREASSSIDYFTHNYAALMSKIVPQVQANQNRSTKQSTLRKDKPICSHCGLNGHTVDKCYRLHGFPPGYKFTKSKVPSHSANHVEISDDIPHLPFTRDQYHQLLALITSPSEISQPATNQVNVPNDHQDHIFSKMTGQYCSKFLSNLDPKHSIFHPSCSFNIASGINVSKSWIIDTGATDHMVNSITHFTSITAVISTHVKLPNGKLALVTHIGTVKLSNTLILTDVLYVPSFSCNLISASKLPRNIRCCFIFITGFYFIQSLAPWKMIGLGKERHGLFYLQQSDSTSNVNSVCFNVSIKNVSDDIWHYRLGHLSLTRLHLLHASFLEISVNTEHVCTVCPLAKQRRLPFAVNKSVFNFHFDLVHCDIWGPFFVPFTNGSKYFLTIVDTFSRFTWLFFMQTKSQARILVQFFFSYFETQFQYKIKVFRTDNGVEFSMPDFYASKGTIHQCSCVETPQQNATVERKHQHLLNVARSLRFQAHLPLMFWGECVLTATHLINRIPTPNLSNKYPFEILFSKPPTYSHLRVIGSLCYASTLTRCLMKFDPQAKPCLFIGYPAGVKGYTLFDLHNKSVSISRDVIFHESIFPYASNLFHTNSDGCFVLPLPHSDSEFMNSESVSPSIYDYVSHSNFESIPNSESESAIVNDISSTQHTSDSVVPSISIRKSSRIKRPPGYLQDFHCNIANSSYSKSIHSTSAVSSGNQYPLSSVLTYDKLSNSHKHFSLSVSTNFEPKFYHQAVKYPNWRATMQSEIDALEQNQTWALVDLPPHKKPIGCKWVYKIKYRYETFSPVTKLTTVRLFIALAAAKGWHLQQLDVNNAFLHCSLDE